MLYTTFSGCVRPGGWQIKHCLILRAGVCARKKLEPPLIIYCPYGHLYTTIPTSNLMGRQATEQLTQWGIEATQIWPVKDAQRRQPLQNILSEGISTAGHDA